MNLESHFLSSTDHWLSAYSNMVAYLHHELKKHWTGFYFVSGEQLVLGPFQGPVACTNIPFGKGVCGTAWKEEKTQIVANVHYFEGHIACSPFSVSEIVVPIFNQEKKVVSVLDIDSTVENDFDEILAQKLEKLLANLVYYQITL